MRFVSPDYTAEAAALRQRVVLISGAGGAIGSALTIACGLLQANVIALGRTVSQLEEVRQQVIQRGGMAPRLYPMDLLGATPRDHDQLAQLIGAEWGRLDALVHCAATFNGLSPLDHIEPLDWLKVIQVNLNAAFLLTRSCLSLLRASNHSVVLFSDDHGDHETNAYWGAYAASKAGARALMQVLACETELDALSVFALDPGPVATRLRRLAYPNGDLPERSPEAVVGAYLRLLIAPQPDWHGHTLRIQKPPGG